MTIPSPFDAWRPTLAAALALTTWGCGTSDPLGIEQGRVRFVLSSAVDGLLTPARSEDLASSARLGADGPAAPTALHGGEDDDHEHRGFGFFQSIDVTFASIVARNLDGVLVDVAMDLPVTVDVVVMDDGRQIVLPDGELPPATYDQLVVVMTEVEGVTRDGTTITITPPGGGWTAIVPICPFVVEEDATTVVGLGFNLRHAFKWREGRFFFVPHFRCEMDAEDGVPGAR